MVTNVRVLGARLSLAPVLPLRFGPALPFRPRSYRPKPRATDLRESEWSKISRYFPTSEMGPRNRKTPIRALISGSLFRLENDIPLREIEQVAPDLPPWGSLHATEARISEAGLWPAILRQIGRPHLIPKLEKLIPSALKYPEPSYGRAAKVNLQGLPTAEA